MITNKIKIYEDGKSPIIQVNGIDGFNVGSMGSNLKLGDEVVLRGGWEWVVEGIEFNGRGQDGYGLIELQTEAE